MNVTQVIKDPDRHQHAAMPEADALTETDVLREAELIDVLFSATDSSVALLFDLRMAISFRMANAAILVVKGVEQLHWEADRPSGPGHRLAHYVVGSEPRVDGARFMFTLYCLMGWTLVAVGTSAEFFVGDVDLPDTPPDYGQDDEETIVRRIPSWDSDFVPGWATFIDNRPS